LAQENASVIAPENGSEHLEQNGALMRGAFSQHAAQRYSANSTGSRQPAQSGG
jgi:hypothetical protein